MEPPQYCSCHSPTDDPGLEFFKVYLPSFSSHQLHIPQGFVKQIKGKLPNKATLADYTGRSWSVQLLEVGSRLFIKNGWEEFAADHSLAFGDFLVFCYHHSSSVFHVKIFGKNGCKKERACPADKAPFIIKIEDDDEEEVEERVEETRVRRSLSRPVRNCKRKYANLEIKELDSSCANNAHRKRLRNGFIHEGSSQHRLGEKFIPKLPHYVAVVTRWNGIRMDIPRSFLKEHQIKLKSTVMLRDQNGKLWPSRISTSKRVAFCHGWREFCRKNLHTNDRCLFEFVLDEGNTCSEVLVRVFHKGLEIEKHSKYWVVKV